MFVQINLTNGLFTKRFFENKYKIFQVDGILFTKGPYVGGQVCERHGDKYLKRKE